MSTATLAEVALPSPDEEVWRYSRISELDLADFAPLQAAPTTEVPAEVDALLEQLTGWAGVVVVRNGFVVHSELAESWAGQGVWFGAASDAAADVDIAPLAEPTDVFAEMNEARCPDPVVLSVPRGLTVDEPFVLIDWVDAAGSASFPRLVVRLGENAQASVVDWHGSSDVRALVAPVVELGVGQAGRLGYVNVQQRGPQIWQIASQVSRVERDATLTAAQAALGGDYARSRADCRLVGRGASGNLAAVYFGEGNQTLDFRTFQDHAAPDTTSNLMFKGAVGGHSRSVYTGLIRVRKEGRGTNAFQTNRNLKLSEHAWAESVPNLEIENNEVRCSHASTVGPVDEDQAFYLESRGVPTAVAERLIVAGFFEEVLAQLPVPSVAAFIRAEIDERLERRES